MLRNGQLLVIDRALRALDCPLAWQHRKTIFLGAMRADVAYVPILGIVFEHLSLTHFYREGIPGGFFPMVMPGPRMMADRHFRHAVAEHGAGRVASAFVQLGKAVHLVVDMACPVHAQAVVHEEDPYEWYVEAHRDELLALPVPVLPRLDRPSAIVESMARITRRFPADRTRNAWGRLMVWLGRWAPVSTATAGAQARELIPAAAAHTAALVDLFLRTVGVAREPSRAA